VSAADVEQCADRAECCCEDPDEPCVDLDLALVLGSLRLQ
jgi:hypothetical protein